MKKFVSLLFILSLLAGLLVVPTHAQSPNLFPNGDIEAMPLQYGYSFDYGAQWYTASGANDTNVHSGSHSLLFDCSNGTMQALLCNVPAAANGFTVNSEYEISFWVKATDGFRGYEFVKLFYAHDGMFTQDYEVTVIPEVGSAFAFANNESNTEGVWEKVTARFTLAAKHGASQEFTTDGFRISFAFGEVVNPGKFYIDDITVTKISGGESEGNDTDQNALSMRVDYPKARAFVGIGYHFTVPDVIVTATDDAGKPLDLSSQVTFSVYHGDVTHWEPLNGLTNVKNTAAARKIFIDRHGYYRIVYQVQNGAKSATAEFYLDVQDTVTDLSTDTRSEPILVHPGDTIDLSDLRIEGSFSYTGKRTLKPSEYTVSPAKAPSDLRTFNVTVKLVGEYDNVTVTKTVTIPFKTVSADTQIDQTRLDLTLPQTEVNISYRLPFVLPDVQATATLDDGTKEDLYDMVTWSAYHLNSDGWGPVASYQDIPLAGEGGRDFLPMEHGYYQIIYKVTRGSKTKTETLAVNIMDTLTEIEADTSRLKTVYAIGEKLDLSGLVVQKVLSYSGQSNVPVGEYIVNPSAYNAKEVGEYTITVSYTAEFGGKKTTSFTVSVVDPVQSAQLTALPTKTTYLYGEALDLTGAQATVQFSVAGEQTVDGAQLEIVGYHSRVLGTQTVSLYYRDVLAGTMEIIVNDKLLAIDIDASNVKKAYNSNESMDLSGLQVTGIYASGARRALTAEEYTATPASFAGAQSGSYIVRIHAKDAQEPYASFRVEVTAVEETSTAPIIITIAVIAAIAILGTAAVVWMKRRKAR